MNGEEMREIRTRFGLTMEELARFLGLTEGAISYFEAGKRRISGPVERLMLLLRDSNGRLLRNNPWNRPKST